MQCHLRDAGVFDVKVIGLGQWQLEQDGQNHADDAAVAEHGDILAGMLRNDLAQAGITIICEFTDFGEKQ